MNETQLTVNGTTSSPQTMMQRKDPDTDCGATSTEFPSEDSSMKLLRPHRLDTVRTPVPRTAKSKRRHLFKNCRKQRNSTPVYDSHVCYMTPAYDRDNLSELSLGTFDFGDPEHYQANAAFETIPAVPKYVRNSWTIRLIKTVDDTLWFRMFRNGQHSHYKELEGDEIVVEIQKIWLGGIFYIQNLLADKEDQPVLLRDHAGALKVVRELLENAKVGADLRYPTTIADDEGFAATAAAAESSAGRCCWPFSTRAAPFTLQVGEI